MFCRQCGQPIQQMQAHCTSCGTPTGFIAPSAYAMPAAPSRVTRHLQTLSILWFAYAGYTVLHWILAVTVMHAIFNNGGHSWFMGSTDFSHIPFMAWLIPFVSTILAIRAVLSFAVGIALLTRQPWGRIFAIILSFFTLIKLFTGTALAIYTLWVLLGPNAQQEYEQLSLDKNAGR